MKASLLRVLLLLVIASSALAQTPVTAVGYTFRGTFLEYNPLGTHAAGTGVRNVIIDFTGPGASNVRYSVYQEDSSAIYDSPGGGGYSYSVVSSGVATLALAGIGLNPMYLNFTSATGGIIRTGNTPQDPQIGTFSLTPTAADPATVRLVNLSSLFTVASGNTNTFGFVIGGTTPYHEIMIRVIGPGLAQFGIQNFAAQPTYQLTGTGGGNNSTDNTDLEPYLALRGRTPTPWSYTPASQATLSAEASLVDTFPLVVGSYDRADIFLLPPGGYTVSGSATGSGGQEMIEVYEVP